MDDEPGRLTHPAGKNPLAQADCLGFLLFLPHVFQSLCGWTYHPFDSAGKSPVGGVFALRSNIIENKRHQ